jgi:hypothetical protein
LAEDDPENEDLQEEKKLFGEEEGEEEKRDEGPDGTHLLRFEFTAMAFDPAMALNIYSSGLPLAINSNAREAPTADAIVMV